MSRREEIIAAARKIAVEQGLERVSVRRVAAEAGIGSSTLRYYFPSNKELFAALADTQLRDLVLDLNLRDETAPAQDRLTELMCQFLPPSDEQLDQLDGTLKMHQLAFEAGELVGNEMLHNNTADGIGIIAEWLEELERQGQRFRHPVAQSAHLLNTMVNGIVLDLIARAPDSTVEEGQEQMRDMVALILVEK